MSLFALGGLVELLVQPPFLLKTMMVTITTVIVLVAIRIAWWGLRLILTGSAQLRLLPDRIVLIYPALLRHKVEIARDNIAFAALDPTVPGGRGSTNTAFVVPRPEPTVGELLETPLYDSELGSRLPVASWRGDVPNLAVILTKPISLPWRRFINPFAPKRNGGLLMTKSGAGFLVRAKSVTQAEQMLRTYPLSVRDISTADVATTLLWAVEQPSPSSRLTQRIKIGAVTGAGLLWGLQIFGGYVPADALAPEVACRRGQQLQASALLVDKEPSYRPLSPGVAFVERLPSGMHVWDEAFLRTVEQAADDKSASGMWREKLAALGYVDGYFIEYMGPDSILKIEVYEFSTHQSALELQDWTNGLNCEYSNDVFTAPDVAGSIGFQVRWPTNGFVGPHTNDQVSFVRGRRRYLIISGNGTDHPPTREVLFDVTRQVEQAEL
ncbi:MAG: hypothetical protein ACRDI3_03785 [Actinomycetota bacterium]